MTYPAMIPCPECGQQFRTVSRLRDHEDDPEQQAACRERVLLKTTATKGSRQ